MPTYTCPRCNHEFSQIGHYKRHLAKQKICEGTVCLLEEYKKYDIDLEDRMKYLFKETERLKKELKKKTEEAIINDDNPIKYDTYTIYKIYCKDTNITESYTGSTKDFKQRKYDHIKSCYNPTNKCYHQKIYKTIRENKGIGNWDFEILEILRCTKYEAECREEYYRNKNNSTMNSRVCRIISEEF